MGGEIRTEGRWTSREGGAKVIDYGDYVDGLDDSIRIKLHKYRDGLLLVAGKHQKPYTEVAHLEFSLDDKAEAEKMERQLVEIAVEHCDGEKALRAIDSYCNSFFYRFLRFIGLI